MRPVILLLSMFLALPALAGPSVVTRIGGVEVTTTLGKDTLDANGEMDITVAIKALGDNPLPKTVRARLGMPGHGHWMTDEDKRTFDGKPMVFIGKYPMYGQYRFRVWMDFDDGINNTAVDFNLPGDPLEAVRVAPMPVTEGTERKVVMKGPIELSLPDLKTGEAVSLASFRGQPVWLAFWATWCGPCRAELPSVDALEERWAGKGAHVLAVSVDKDPALARRYLHSLNVDLPGFIDPDGEGQQVFDAVRLPLNVLLAADGSVVFREEGYRGDFLDHANKLIAEQLR